MGVCRERYQRIKAAEAAAAASAGVGSDLLPIPIVTEAAAEGKKASDEAPEAEAEVEAAFIDQSADRISDAESDASADSAAGIPATMTDLVVSALMDLAGGMAMQIAPEKANPSRICAPELAPSIVTLT